MTRAGKIAVFLLLLATPAFGAPGLPSGWSVSSPRPQDYEFGTDAVKGASGKLAAYVKAKPGAQTTSSGGMLPFGGMMQCIRADNYLGQRLRFAARLKGEAASGILLWMRVDGPRNPDGTLGKALRFYNMQDRPITGTTDWQRAEVVLDVPNESAGICYGFLLQGGRGEAWADGLSLTRVGKDVPESKMPEQPKSPVNLSFDR
jgi:hypothetical protein